VPRHLFVPTELRDEAYDDGALAIGHGQTISQPFIVALICASLALRGDERVLDIGTGSGYQAAVLSELAAEVVSVERIPQLLDDARENLAVAGYADRVELRLGDGREGVSDRAPFGGIAVAAASPDVPEQLWRQLAVGGRLVLPVAVVGTQRLVVLERTEGGRRLLGTTPVRFVPLVGG